LGRIYYLADQHLDHTHNVERPPSATKLDKAGVKIKEFLGRDLLDIQFHKNNCLESYPFLNCSWLLHCMLTLYEMLLGKNATFLGNPSVYHRRRDGADFLKSHGLGAMSLSLRILYL
jgi:hypothetical protein